MNRETEILLQCFAVIAFLLVVLFFAFAFGRWDANPANWSTDMRVGFVILALIIILGVLITGGNIIKDSEASNG